eukprot:Ihof_evm2s106 gene=Ihof_evmTU2s106
MSKAVGLDLGSFNCCVAICKDDGTSEVISNAAGDRTTAAYVSFTDEEQAVGFSAKQLMSRNARNTVFAAKHMIGQSSSTLDDSIKSQLQCNIVDKEGVACFEVDYKEQTVQMSPLEITSILAHQMKQTAEDYTSSPVTECVVAVPAHFTEEQSKIVVEGCRKAGLEVLRTINEPVAAALAYKIGQNDPKEIQKVLVVDVGASSVDVTILDVTSGIYHINKTTHSANIGGSCLDERLMKYFASEFQRMHKMDPLSNKRAAWKLRVECQRVVQVMSTSQQTMCSIDSLMDGIDLHSQLNRGKFESLCNELLVQMMGPVHAILAESGLDKSEISKVILSGGTTKIPRLQQLLAEYFGAQTTILNHISPDEVVACGASMQAGLLHGHTHIYQHNDYKTCTGIAASIGIEDVNGNMLKLLAKGTPLPTRQIRMIPASEAEQSLLVRVLEGENK